MGTTIRFKRVNKTDGDYFVAVEGASDVFIGHGEDGRVKALAFLKFVGLKQQLKALWLEKLENLRWRCLQTAEIEAAFHGDECEFAASLDGVFVSLGWDDVTVDLAVDRAGEPDKGPPPDGPKTRTKSR